MDLTLNDDDIVDLLNRNISDIDEFNERKEVNFENLDEVLSELHRDIEVIIM